MPRQIVVMLAIVGAFGVLLPLYKGYDFLDRRLIVAYACLSAVIAVPIVIDRFAQPDEDVPQLSLLRIWIFSWTFSAFLLAAALFTVNAANWRGRMILPRSSFLAAAECLSLTIAAAVAGLAALLARRFSAANVRAGFRALFLIAVVGLFLADRYGALAMTAAGMTQLLFVLSSLFGAAALVMHAMLRLDASHSRDRRGAGGV